MDKRKLMLLLGALVVAIGTALAARSMLGGGSTPQAEAAQQVAQGPKVLVAQRALPVGTIITQDALSFQAWPKEMVKDAYFLEGEADMNKLLGTVVRFPITAGQPMTQGALVRPGDRGFLAAALGPGMRAVTITVSARTGVAGFVFPGDHVDLMLTQTVSTAGGDSGQPLNTTETVLRNLRVLATDQSTEQEIVDGKTVVKAFGTQTLEETRLHDVSAATVQSALKARKVKSLLSPVVSIMTAGCVALAGVFLLFIWLRRGWLRSASRRPLSGFGARDAAIRRVQQAGRIRVCDRGRPCLPTRHRLRKPLRWWAW